MVFARKAEVDEHRLVSRFEVFGNPTHRTWVVSQCDDLPMSLPHFDDRKERSTRGAVGGGIAENLCGQAAPTDGGPACRPVDVTSHRHPANFFWIFLIESQGSRFPDVAEKLSHEKELLSAQVGALHVPAAGPEIVSARGAACSDTCSSTRAPAGTRSCSRPGGSSAAARLAPASITARPRPASFSFSLLRIVSAKPPDTESGDFTASKIDTEVCNRRSSREFTRGVVVERARRRSIIVGRRQRSGAAAGGGGFAHQLVSPARRAALSPVRREVGFTGGGASFVMVLALRSISMMRRGR